MNAKATGDNQITNRVKARLCRVADLKRRARQKATIMHGENGSKENGAIRTVKGTVDKDTLLCRRACRSFHDYDRVAVFFAKTYSTASRMRLALMGPVFLGMIRVRAAPEGVRGFTVAAARFVVRLAMTCTFLRSVEFSW